MRWDPLPAAASVRKASHSSCLQRPPSFFARCVRSGPGAAGIGRVSARVAPAKFGNLELAAAAYNADPQRRARLARFANGPGCFSSDRFAMCYPGLRWLFYTPPI
jgi:hypothetical protein